MTLQQMEYIVALNKHRHFVLAAEACGVTQPTLSAMIQKLEEELQVKIFNRDRNNISPTSVGAKIIKQAQVALNEARRVKEVVADEAEAMSGSVRIGVLPTIAPYVVPDFIYHFREAYPQVDLFVDEKASKSLLQDLRYGNLDMALTTTPIDMEGLLEVTVYVERFVAYFSNLCSKAQELMLSGELPAEHMWILKEGHCAANGAQSFCKNKEKGNHIYEAGSIETLVRIVDRNGGYTVVPELHLNFLTEQQRQHTAIIRNDPLAKRFVSLVVREDFVRERMLNAVLEVLKQIIPQHMLQSRMNRLPIKL